MRTIDEVRVVNIWSFAANCLECSITRSNGVSFKVTWPEVDLHLYGLATWQLQLATWLKLCALLHVAIEFGKAGRRRLPNPKP